MAKLRTELELELSDKASKIVNNLLKKNKLDLFISKLVELFIKGYDFEKTGENSPPEIIKEPGLTSKDTMNVLLDIKEMILVMKETSANQSGNSSLSEDIIKKIIETTSTSSKNVKSDTKVTKEPIMFNEPVGEKIVTKSSGGSKKAKDLSKLKKLKGEV